MVQLRRSNKSLRKNRKQQQQQQKSHRQRNSRQQQRRQQGGAGEFKDINNNVIEEDENSVSDGEIEGEGTYLRLVDEGEKTFVSLGIMHPYRDDRYLNSDLFPIGEIVTLTQGKFPLNDFNDLYENSGKTHTFRFQDGTTQEVELMGFDKDCESSSSSSSLSLSSSSSSSLSSSSSASLSSSSPS